MDTSKVVKSAYWTHLGEEERDKHYIPARSETLRKRVESFRASVRILTCPTCCKSFWTTKKKKKFCNTKCAQNKGYGWAELVKEIIRLRGGACEECNWDLAKCDVHHIIPRSDGGDNSHANLRVLCPNCHRVTHGK